MLLLIVIAFINKSRGTLFYQIYHQSYFSRCVFASNRAVIDWSNKVTKNLATADARAGTQFFFFI